MRSIQLFSCEMKSGKRKHNVMLTLLASAEEGYTNFTRNGFKFVDWLVWVASNDGMFGVGRVG